MATPKYKEYFTRMLEVEKTFFDNFRRTHDLYTLEPTKWQAVFNEQGEKAQLMIRHWENLLCSRSEKSGYGTYTAKLAEKFWEQVRHEFPMIDRVGLKEKVPSQEEQFTLKKINLS